MAAAERCVKFSTGYCVQRTFFNTMADPLIDAQYPRPLLPREREWIAWILPADRPGYKHYREIIDAMEVIGEGRRGSGEIILGQRDARIDVESPLPSVYAYGVIETNFGTISITV